MRSIHMIKSNRILHSSLLMIIMTYLLPQPIIADTAKQIDKDVSTALSQLYAETLAAKELSKVAKGILVFPRIIKAGFIVGGQYGEGALRVNDKTKGYYNTAAASFGLQAGAEAFGYALFFMTDLALKYLESSAGWEIGIGPNITVIDQGAAGSFSTTTAKDDIYVFFFHKKGLMAGLGVQGSKISRIVPSN